MSARARTHGPALHALRFGAAALLLRAALCVHAQVAPSAAEIQSYGPLHAAALRGDLPTLAATIAGRAPLDARDGHGRTALHVATFASQREAIKLLAAAGADLGALENDRYDAVTIAAVADDEETLALLLSLGASAKLTTSRYDGTALIAAAHLGHDGVVRQLIACRRAARPREQPALDRDDRSRGAGRRRAAPPGHAARFGRRRRRPERSPIATAAPRCSWRARAASRRWCRSSRARRNADAALCAVR